MPYLKKNPNHWARQTGFIKRQRRLSAKSFLMLMTIGQLGMKHPSLAGMVDAFNSKMSREALHFRFTKSAADYLNKCAEFVFQQKINETAPIQSEVLRPFRHVFIVDSSSWDIHPKLQQILPGSGGGASMANCKIQIGYEYKKGVISFFEITPGIKPDSAYTRELPHQVQPKDLLLTDLGYFCLKTFHDIDQKGAFFLSRFLIGTSLVNSKTSTSIDLVQTLTKIPGDICQMEVIMGSKEKTKVHCRLICLRVSEQIANERRRRLKKQALKKGRIVNRFHLILADWTLMVTNVPEKWLAPEKIRPFYSLRWQIELLFKQIKSVLQIHQINTTREHRLRCEVYGNLIMAMLIHRVHGSLNIKLWNNQSRELSMDKFYKRLQERAFTFMQLLLISFRKSINFLRRTITRFMNNCMKYQQRSRKSSLEILEFGFLPKINAANFSGLT